MVDKKTCHIFIPNPCYDKIKIADAERNRADWASPRQDVKGP